MSKLVTTKTGRRLRIPDPAEDMVIDAGVRSDPDTFELTAEQFKQLRRAGRPRLQQPKVPTTIRFDADVLSQLKASGPGWQTRVNALLRQWLKLGA